MFVEYYIKYEVQKNVKEAINMCGRIKNFTTKDLDEAESKAKQISILEKQLKELKGEENE